MFLVRMDTNARNLKNVLQNKYGRGHGFPPLQIHARGQAGPRVYATHKKIVIGSERPGGEMIRFLSHQGFSSEPSFITERASMKPVPRVLHAWLHAG